MPERVTKQEERDAAWRSSMSSRHRKLADRPKCGYFWFAKERGTGHHHRCQKIPNHPGEHKCHCRDRKPSD